MIRKIVASFAMMIGIASAADLGEFANLPKKKVVITFGAFDPLHDGHTNILAKAAALGEKLYVGISSDDFIERRKNKKPMLTQERRANVLRRITGVTDVFFETGYYQKPYFIDFYKADYLVLGDDWKGVFDNIHPNCQTIYFPRTEGISSTLMLSRFKGEGDNAPLKKFYNESAGPARALTVYQTMKDIHEAFVKCKATYVLFCGGLLGAARHEGFIPWDTDLDIGIFEDKLEGVGEAFSLLAAAGYQLCPNPNNMKVSMTKDDLETEFCFFSKKDSGYYLPRNLLFPPRLIPFGDLHVYAPRDFVGVLNHVYGKEWPITVRMPDSHPATPASRFLPLGPFGPLKEVISQLNHVDKSVGEQVLRRNISLFQPVITKASFAGEIEFTDGASFHERHSGFWLIDGKATLTFKPDEGHQHYTIKLFGNPFSYIKTAPFEVKYTSGSQSGVTVYNSLTKSLDFEITNPSANHIIELEMPFESARVIEKSKDTRNLSYYIRTVDVRGDKPQLSWQKKIKVGESEAFGNNYFNKRFTLVSGFDKKEEAGVIAKSGAIVDFIPDFAQAFVEVFLVGLDLKKNIYISVLANQEKVISAFELPGNHERSLSFSLMAKEGKNNLSFLIDGQDNSAQFLLRKIEINS